MILARIDATQWRCDDLDGSQYFVRPPPRQRRHRRVQCKGGARLRLALFPRLASR
jgi:hypothetical protein